MVELNEQFEEGDQPAASPAKPQAAPETRRDVVRPPSPEAEAVDAAVVAEAPVTPAGDQADGVRLVGQILTTATTARWPIYLRNVKQLLRAADGGFDERRYGFSGLIDLLRACQSDGLVRLERDRRGGLLVFKGPVLQQTGATRSALPQQDPGEAASDNVVESMDAGAREQLGELNQGEPDNRLEPQAEAVDDDKASEIGPIPIDTTAEPLGRAKPRRPRARVGSATPAAARSTRKTTAPKKPAAHPTTRSRKTVRSDSGGKNES
jgi:hypothetical protein